MKVKLGNEYINVKVHNKELDKDTEFFNKLIKDKKIKCSYCNRPLKLKNWIVFLKDSRLYFYHYNKCSDKFDKKK